MSMYSYIYDALIEDAELATMIAKNPLDGSPAVYEERPGDAVDFPYVQLNYTIGEGNHWARKDGILSVDIFGNRDLVELESIKNHILYILDRQIIKKEQADRVRLYWRSDQPFEEPEPDVKRWNLELTLRVWRADFVDQFIERGDS